MPRGACVIERPGKRDTTFAIKYVDAAGDQCWEPVGKASEGMTRRKAEAELRDRLVRVEKRGWRKPAPLTFAAYSKTWLEGAERRRALKPSTVRAYRCVLRHLNEKFGAFPIATIRPRHVAAYVAGSPLAPNTVNVHLSVLHDILESAVREELIEANPARRAERPKRPKQKWRILGAAETRAVVAGYDELIRKETDERERAYLHVHRLAFLTLMLTGLRQSELRGLRCRDVDLIENVLRVVDSKTDDGIRSIALPPILAEELWQHRRRTAFQGDDEIVLSDPNTGGRYGISRHRDALNAALALAGITDRVRPHHDLRHACLTHDAAAGTGEVALMTKAGHSSIAVTKQYMHLARIVFRDEADALERRLLGTAELATQSATHLSEPHST